MSSKILQDESIKVFLERLKLSDKYAETFISHGYLTVGDCYGITEDTLKGIGVTLTGHYRRILSKLPGCSVKKPPRSQRMSSVDPETAVKPPLDLTGPSPVDAVDVFEAEDVYEIESPRAVIERSRGFREEIGDTRAQDAASFAAKWSAMAGDASPSKEPPPSATPPAKPPRSPECIRKQAVPLVVEAEAAPLPALAGEFESVNELPVPPSSSPHSICKALDIMLGESPEETLCITTKEDIYEEALGSITSNTSDMSVKHMPLPSPPTPRHSADFPSPPPHPSTGFWEDDDEAKKTAEEGEYDRLNITRSGATNYSGKNAPVAVGPDDVSDPYNMLGDPSCVKQVVVRPEAPVEPLPQNLQVAPPRRPAYEVIHLKAEEDDEIYDVPPRRSPSATKSDRAEDSGVDGAAKPASSVATPVAFNITGSDTIQCEDVTDDDALLNHSDVRRSKSFDIYDVADNVESVERDNVYDVCVNDTNKDRSSARTTELMADFNATPLPRASGSLPASTINPRLKRSPVLMQAHARLSPKKTTDNASDHSSDGDDHRADTYKLTGLPASDKLNHDKSSVSAMKSKRNNSSGMFLRKSKLRLGGNSKGARPLSAFVDNFRLGQNHGHSSSEENLETIGAATRKQHKRATSISDAKLSGGGSLSSVEFIDAQISDAPRSPSVNEVQAAPNLALLQKKTKKGWLYKHGGHEGRSPLRKRWVVFDGDELVYYESDTKMELSKGIIPVAMILRVQVTSADSKVFHIQTKGGRKYIFNAETTEEKNLWTSTLLAAKLIHEKQTQDQFKPGGSMYMPYKEGSLKMEGIRQKTYLATKGDQLAYYKSQNEFNFGQPVARLSMKIATVKEMDKKRFQIVFPFRTFSFIADNEEDKHSWVEALQDAIAEGLSDYKVVNEVWGAEANRKCADCGRDDPDWASINLGIVICKHCAGVHRDLGVHNSKVRSLKMDVKIWNDTMKNLLLMLGNSVANSFWKANLNSSESINDMADKNLRSWHITSKYIEMRYSELHRYTGDQEKLNQALIGAVRDNALDEVYRLVFSGADPNCATGKEHGRTPCLLAKYLDYRVVEEFLTQNGATSDVSPRGHVTDRSNCVRRKDSIPKTRSKPAVMLKNNLFKYGGDFRSAAEERKQSRSLDFIMRKQGDFQKRVCVLENNIFKYFDPERPNTAKDEVECSELISVGISTPEQATKAGFSHCFEVSRTTGRTYLFCSEKSEVAAAWTRGLMQAIVPPHVQNAMKQDLDYDRIGKMSIKSQHLSKKPSEWKPTWCKLKGKKLYYFHQDSITMECIDLRRLVQIGLDLTQEGTTGPSSATKEAVPTFMLVFREKSYYLRSDTKADSESWLAAIRKADSDYGSDLSSQQLTAEGVPLILEKCMTYVEQFGLTARGIYRLNGTHSKTSQLLNDFQQNARDTQMRDTELNVHDVSSALKRWFKSLPGSLLTVELHEQWIETSQIKQEHHDRKLQWYKHLIEKLPEINRNTLKVLLVHLKNVASHEKENDMSVHNLAIVFGPTLLQPQTEGDKKYVGETSQEIGCVEDLLRYYDWLFDITEVDREKERLMLQAKEKISMATQQQGMLTTLDYDMMVPIYIGNKDDKCVNYKVNMTAGELIARICRTHGYPPKTWGLFEVISDGDAERPLHFSEHVLSIIKSWEMPSTNYLLAKHDYVHDKLRWLKAPSGEAVDALYEGFLKVYEPKKKWVRVNAVLKVMGGQLTLSYVKSQEAHATVRDVAYGNWRKRSTKVHSISRKIGGNFDAKSATHISLGLYNAYVGVDRKTKPPSVKSWGFTLANRGEITRYFVADTETYMYKWYGHIAIQKFPQGFTPPNSPLLSPEIDVTARLPPEYGNTKRFAFPGISQGDLGEAAKAAALQRAPPPGAEEQSRDNNATYKLVTDDAQNEQSTGERSRDVRPTHLPTNQTRRPTSFVTSPSEQNRSGGFLGAKLHTELSSVLRKKRPNYELPKQEESHD